MPRVARRALPVATLVLAVALALAAPLAAGASGGSPQGRFLIDEEWMMHDCQQLLSGPDQFSANGILGGDTISLDTLVVLDVEGMEAVARIDRVEEPEAYQAALDALVARYAPLLDVASQSYDALDIDLNIVRYDLLKPLEEDGSARVRTTNAREIINLTKAQYGGGRPLGTDVVYTLTDLDIQLPGLGNAVAGLADCIGGVTFDDRAFAVGEVSDEINLFVYTFYKDATAKIFAHEVGHLMGGHHHYQSCVTPVPGAFTGNGEVGPCSLMSNFVDFVSLPFSPVNSAVVRGHAEAYAAANDGDAVTGTGTGHEGHDH